MPEEPLRRVMRSATARSRGAAQPDQRLAGRRSTSSVAYEQETVQDEVVGPRQFQPGDEPAFVRVSAGRTISLGKFESLRIDVSVTLPCLPNEIDVTYDLASEFVQEKMESEEVSWMGPKPKAAQRRS